MSKEVILTVGFPSSGKSIYIKQYEKKGFKRLNRDDMGGTLKGVDKALEAELKITDKIVLDNTYVNVASRANAIRIAKAAKAKVICLHLTTSIEDSQLNSCMRIMNLDDSHTDGSLKPFQIFQADYLSSLKNTDAIPVIALFSFRKKFEAPTIAEGFDDIQKVKFTRNPSKVKNKAIIFDFDGTLRETIDGAKYPVTTDNIRILPNRTEVLRKYKEAGYYIFGASNQSGVGKGILTENQVEKLFDFTIDKLNVEFDEYAYCPHGSFPIQCYCRKPLGGIGAYYIYKYDLSPEDCVMVGDMKIDETFAKRCGFKFQWAKDFFNKKLNLF